MPECFIRLIIQCKQFQVQLGTSKGSQCTLKVSIANFRINIELCIVN